MRKSHSLLTAAITLSMLMITAHSFAHEDTHRRQVSTNGVGEIKVAPDMAIINLSVHATHSTGKAAKQDVDDRVNLFLDTLKKSGIKKDDIVASNLRISPRYNHSAGSRQFEGYEAARTLNITLRKISALTYIVDKALEHRLEGVDQISYDHSKADQFRAQAHQLAIENSKLKASTLAKAYDAELGPVITINYHNNTPIYDGFSPKMESGMALSASRSRPGTYIADELVFNDTIQVTFDLIVSPNQ